MIQEALELIDAEGLDRAFLGPRFAVSDDEIIEAESRLGRKFPESYRLFLKLVGRGDFEGIEFPGIFANDVDHPSALNALWLTSELRKKNQLPCDHFVVENFHGDAYACLLLSHLPGGECPVIMWDLSENRDRQINKPYILANSYGEYFYNKIKELIEDSSI